MTTAAESLNAKQQAQIDELVKHYRENLQPKAVRLAAALFDLADAHLGGAVHSLRSRAKDPEHLRDKLARKMQKCLKDQIPFDISPENLFEKINDLAGLRILHLHTSQFPEINKSLTEILSEEEYDILEGPVARIWDDEYKQIFGAYNIPTQPNPRMYTSVHYVVAPAGKKKVTTAEIQVRTLAEELWGEVDHTINYPHPTDIKSCQEQIKVLARVTSSCSRLVDSIFIAKTQAEAAIQLPGEMKSAQARIPINRRNRKPGNKR